MKIDTEDLVAGRNDNHSCVSPELQRYSEAKLHEAEQREQELFDRPCLIEKIINKIKCRFKTR